VFPAHSAPPPLRHGYLLLASRELLLALRRASQRRWCGLNVPTVSACGTRDALNSRVRAARRCKSFLGVVSYLHNLLDARGPGTAPCQSFSLSLSPDTGILCRKDPPFRFPPIRLSISGGKRLSRVLWTSKETSFRHNTNVVTQEAVSPASQRGEIRGNILRCMHILYLSGAGCIYSTYWRLCRGTRNVTQVEARCQVEPRRPGNTSLTPPCEAFFSPRHAQQPTTPTAVMVELIRYRPPSRRAIVDRTEGSERAGKNHDQHPWTRNAAQEYNTQSPGVARKKKASGRLM